MSFVYLAIPYTSKNPDPAANAAERAARMKSFWEAAAYLIDAGHHVVSPMTLEPALLAAPDMPYRWEHWKEYSIKMVGISSRVVVLMLDGWQESTGVTGEIAEAHLQGLDVEFLDPVTVNNWLKPRKEAVFFEAQAQSIFRAHKARGRARLYGESISHPRRVFPSVKLEDACADETWETLPEETKEIIRSDLRNLLSITVDKPRNRAAG